MLVGLRGDAQDRLEHYCRCPIALEVLRDKLRIDLHPSRALTFYTFGTSEQAADSVLALGALYVYAVYMCSNHYRHAGYASAARSKAFIGQCIIQGCQGHTELANLLDRRWQSPMVIIH